MKFITYVLTIALATAASVVSAQQIHATVDGTAPNGSYNSETVGMTAIQYPIAFGGNFLFYVWGGPRAEARAITIAGRLVRVLTDTTLTPADVHVVRVAHTEAVVYVGKVPFATATKHDAVLSGMTSFATANHWSDQIKLVISNITMIAGPGETAD
jgi:hypothetical protein